MDIHDSVTQILDTEVPLGEKFYAKFLATQPDVRAYFEGVDMNRQAVMLTMALLVIEQYQGCDYPMMSRYLKELGDKHRGLDIPREFFPLFCQTLLETLAEYHGDDWDEDLANQWADAIDQTTVQMLKAYD